MSCKTHEGHDHKHGSDCGHKKLNHEGHVDYLHDGHLHHLHEEHIDEHVLAVSDSNPKSCTPEHSCEGHEKTHTHGAGCGHDAIPHGDHVDYLVNGHLHHQHDGHCDDHGSVSLN